MLEINSWRIILAAYNRDTNRLRNAYTDKFLIEHGYVW